MTQINANEWDMFTNKYPDIHILQSRSWGELKSQFGWKVKYFISGNVGAQVLFKELPLGFNIAYIPKGPIGSNWSLLLNEIDNYCKKHRTVFLKIEPDLWDSDIINNPILFYDLRSNATTVQPRRTIVLDLEKDEQDILSNMKQKTRYNIRLAQKKGVKVIASDDIVTFHKLMQETSMRDGFGVHNLTYYQNIYSLTNQGQDCKLFIAYHDGIALASIMVFSSGNRAWYFYGASSNQGRNLMPSYLLQWEAIKWAKQIGCKEYDLWGVPDENLDVLENNFLNRSTGLWGVYRFKRGFGGQLKRSIGAWDKVYIPVLYSLYTLINKYRHSNDD